MKTQVIPDIQLAAAQSRAARRRIAFTLIELLVVISIIGLLAGLIVGLVKVVGPKKTESTVRAELKQWELVIENYKSKIGPYPPDNTNNPALAPLYYELAGTVASSDGKTFRTLLGSGDTIKQQHMLLTFGLAGFVNSGEEARTFLPQNLKSERISIFTNNTIRLEDNVRILVSSVRGPRGEVIPWRYVSSNATNNPGSYDLWVEIAIGGKTTIIGNWKD